VRDFKVRDSEGDSEVAKGAIQAETMSKKGEVSVMVAFIARRT
jgi:hypothetical protein